ncbi:MAG: MBOAT family protein [Lachnospiraceae bacterium]|nr:MBOAT family protein [Lachnospiraceae bacterium]
MVFSSIPFLYYFLPITMLLYLLVPKKLKNAVLLASSLLFYAWGEKLLVVLFAGSILVGWGTGLLLERTHKPLHRKMLLGLALLFDLGLLGYFKYADFFLANINALLGTDLPLLHVALPIGISFYTFQLLSYNIDVYRQTVPAQKNPVNFAAYVSMFPQLIAGPIVRYADVCDSLSNRKHSLEMISSGITRFSIGLGKKVLLANLLGEFCSQFRSTTQPAVLYYWLYALCYTLQIYYDFSGYSDMAIGLGRIFGFRFMENFNYPYISASVTEFWRRWHISLGSWFRDYVYIPLGGNRKGLQRQLINILVVWMLTGLWHGAAWNFVLWGLFYALLLTIEKMGFKKWLDGHKLFGHIYTLAAVILGFLIFNAEGISGILQDLSGLFSFGRLPLANAECLYYLRSFGIVMLAGILGATPLPAYGVQMLRGKGVGGRVWDVVEVAFPAVLLVLATAFLVDGSFNPFLYFRF